MFKTAHVNAESSKENGGLSQLTQIAHKLDGSGGTFGFPSISEAARNLEFSANRTAGADAVQHLRSTTGIECPVIVTTVHDNFEARRVAVRAGCDAFLTKSVVVADLVQLLDSSTNQDDDEPQRVLMIDDDPDIIQFVLRRLPEQPQEPPSDPRFP